MLLVSKGDLAGAPCDRGDAAGRPFRSPRFVSYFATYFEDVLASHA